MNKADAVALLSREVPAAVEPVLDSQDLDDLVMVMAVPDAAGIAPDAPGWAPTFDASWLMLAAAKAWERKAGRLAGLMTFSADGAQFDAGELHRQAIRMQRSYLSRCAGTTQTRAAALIAAAELGGS